MLRPVYTVCQCQRCENSDATDQFGIANHFWNVYLGILRNLQALNQQHIVNDVADMSPTLIVNGSYKEQTVKTVCDLYIVFRISQRISENMKIPEIWSYL